MSLSLSIVSPLVHASPMSYYLDSSILFYAIGPRIQRFEHCKAYVRPYNRQTPSALGLSDTGFSTVFSKL